MTELYDFPADHVGRKAYVSVRGHDKSVPKFKTYRGTDSRNHLLPEYGGDWAGMGKDSSFIMPDKAAYHSPLDGSVVEGRNAHRDHMKRHNVLEAGDMKIGEYGNRERAPMPSAREDLRRAFSQHR